MRDRGRDIEGCIKQWITFVKPNTERYVKPQGNVAGMVFFNSQLVPPAQCFRTDIIIPRGIENVVAINMVVHHIRRTLEVKSQLHQWELKKLNDALEDVPLSDRVMLLSKTNQITSMTTIIQDPATDGVDFIFYFDRLSSLLVERALEHQMFKSTNVITPQGTRYSGLEHTGEVSAVVILRGGSCLETGLKRVIPECKTGRMLIQTNYHTGEPELHYLKLGGDIAKHDIVLLLDPQMSSGGAALMAVRVLVDHGVAEDKIVFITFFAGKVAINRLTKVFPKIRVVVSSITEDFQGRWIEKRYFGC